jgi:DNA-binding HxlR family transcriptional regulator
MKLPPMKNDVLRPPVKSSRKSAPATFKQKDHVCSSVDHKQRVLAMNDAMEVLSGKWKIPLLGTLIFGGKMRFMDLLRNVDGIAAKMLSKELQDLEMHQIITRTVLQTKPITVEYEITEYGKSLRPLIIEITDWGLNHRQKIMKG